MKARFLAETLYSTLLTQIVPSISSTWNELDIFEIFVDSAPRYNSWWVILDFENKIKRDLIFFHNRVWNTLYYYRKDRDILGNGSISSQHQVQASVRMNDNAWWINHALSNVDDFGQIMKWWTSNKIRVYGWKVTINESVVDIADSTITVPSGTKEVVLDYADNTIKIIDTSWLSTLVGQRLGTVVSSGSAITSVSDVRTAFAPLRINPAFFTYSGGKLVIATNAITTAQILDGSITISKMAANSVGTTQIVDQSITYEKVGLEAIGILNMKPNSVWSNQIVSSSVTRSKIEADAIDSTKLADDAVGAEHIQAWAVWNSEIATNAVTAEKVATGAIEKAKIAANAVDWSKIEANAITQDKMADASVGTAEIIDGNITKQKMAANSVGTSQLEDNSVTPAKIPDWSIPQSKLWVDSVWQSQIQANAVGTDEIAPSAVWTSEIANSAVTQDKLAANSVGTSQIQNLSIITEKLVDLWVTAPKIADSAVVSRTIGAQQVLNTHIGIWEITSANIQNRTVTGTDIALSTIKGENIENGTITAEKLDAAITGLSLKVGLDSLDVAWAWYLLQKIKQWSGAVIQEVLDAGIRKLEISFNTGSLYVYTGSEWINVVGQDMRLWKALWAVGTAWQITTDREIVSNDKAILMSGQWAKFAVWYTSSDVIHSSLQWLSLATAILETPTSITLWIQHSNVIATANNLVFTLPAAATCKGRSYTIGRKSVAYALLWLKTTDWALLYAFWSQNSNVTISWPDRTYACGNYPYVFSITSNGIDWMLTSSAIDDDDVSAAIALKEDSSNKSNSTADIASTTKFPTWWTVSWWVSAWFATIASVALKANDSAVLHNTGNETSTGLKKFENIWLQSQTPWDNDIIFEIADSTNRWSKMRLSFKRYRGTLASKANTVVWDVLWVISFSWWNGADKSNGSIQVTDNWSRWKTSVTWMDVEFDWTTKVTTLWMMWNALVDLTEWYGPNWRVWGSDGNFAMRIRRADGWEIAAFRWNQEIVMSNGWFMIKENWKNISLNENNTERNSIITLKTKNNANAWGMHWVHYADADWSIVGNKRYALRWYPRDDSGTNAWYNQYRTIDHPANWSNHNDYNFRSSIYDVPKITFWNNIQWYYWSWTSPEWSLTANPGSTAQMSNGTMWLKVTWTWSTWWKQFSMPSPAYWTSATAWQKSTFSTTSTSLTTAVSMTIWEWWWFTWSFDLYSQSSSAFAYIFKNWAQQWWAYGVWSWQTLNFTWNIDLLRNDIFQIRIVSNTWRTATASNMKLMYWVSFSAFNATVS